MRRLSGHWSIGPSGGLRPVLGTDQLDDLAVADQPTLGRFVHRDLAPCRAPSDPAAPVARNLASRCQLVGRDVPGARTRANHGFLARPRPDPRGQRCAIRLTSPASKRVTQRSFSSTATDSGPSATRARSTTCSACGSIVDDAVAVAVGDVEELAVGGDVARRAAGRGRCRPPRSASASMRYTRPSVAATHTSRPTIVTARGLAPSPSTVAASSQAAAVDARDARAGRVRDPDGAGADGEVDGLAADVRDGAHVAGGLDDLRDRAVARVRDPDRAARGRQALGFFADVEGLG